MVMSLMVMVPSCWLLSWWWARRSLKLMMMMLLVCVSQFCLESYRCVLPLMCNVRARWMTIG